jgi:formate hydrogenlyase subunit 4
MLIFTLAFLAGTTALSPIAAFMASGAVGLQVSLALALIALIVVVIAESGRIPVDNPATHLELTMVHEAMVLEYSGRHLALIEAAGMLRLTLYMSLIACVFVPWGLDTGSAAIGALLVGLLAYVAKIAVASVLLAGFETSIAKMRVFRYTEFLGGALLLALLAALFLYLEVAL